MDELIKKLANDYIQTYIQRTGKNPTSDLVANVVSMVKRDIAEATEKGMTYEDMYKKAFADQTKEGILNNNARAAGSAYELMSTPELRSQSVGELTGQGRGQRNPKSVNPNIYQDVGAGQGVTGTTGSYFGDPRQWLLQQRNK
jgi:hypothetical protein